MYPSPQVHKTRRQPKQSVNAFDRHSINLYYKMLFDLELANVLIILSISDHTN